jgi:3-oxoacyl-[acyl-carrier-protein] synthase III
MRFEDLRLAAIEAALPETVLTSEDLEERLAPLYDRLGVRVGRLELMTGIAERRLWPVGTRPSDAATLAGKRALERCGIGPERIGALAHAAVSRDFLEPATASVVHRALGLPGHMQVFDLSNACLGFVNSILAFGAQIEAGLLDAALIVSGEDGGPLLEGTIAGLLGAEHADRALLKRAFASLTIGAGAAAAVIARGDLAPNAPRILGGHVQADTSHVELCQGDRSADGSGLWMETDSEALLHAGCALAARTWPGLLDAVGWEARQVERVVTHQVGVAHRKALLGALDIDPARDFPTVERLGNIGSVSLPATFALARDAGHLRAGQRVAWLGIGSGLHCAMLGVQL